MLGPVWLCQFHPDFILRWSWILWTSSVLGSPCPHCDLCMASGKHPRDPAKSGVFLYLGEARGGSNYRVAPAPLGAWGILSLRHFTCCYPPRLVIGKVSNFSYFWSLTACNRGEISVVNRHPATFTFPDSSQHKPGNFCVIGPTF